MKLSLSTNWCNQSLSSGEAIADLALSLGFQELELGFRTTADQVDGFKKRLDEIRVGSVHAYCPVPISAPQGYPELYTILTKDKDARALAVFHIIKNIEFASEIGADTVVLHMGRVHFSSIFKRSFDSGFLSQHLQKSADKINDKKYQKYLLLAKKRRNERGKKALDIFESVCDELFPVLEKNKVTLAFENLPYLEAFPNEVEISKILNKHKGSPIAAWFDTGHHRVREMHGWLESGEEALSPFNFSSNSFAGIHLNDVIDYHDDHFAPGGGNVDFKALLPLAKSVKHLVFEPHSHVSEEDLKKSILLIKSIWMEQ